MAAVMKCERKLDSGLKLVVMTTPFRKGDERPPVVVEVQGAGAPVQILSGIPGEVRDLAKWLDSRAGEIEDMHSMTRRGWMEEGK